MRLIRAPGLCIVGFSIMKQSTSLGIEQFAFRKVRLSIGEFWKVSRPGNKSSDNESLSQSKKDMSGKAISLLKKSMITRRKSYTLVKREGLILSYLSVTLPVHIKE